MTGGYVYCLEKGTIPDVLNHGDFQVYNSKETIFKTGDDSGRVRISFMDIVGYGVRCAKIECKKVTF